MLRFFEILLTNQYVNIAMVNTIFSQEQCERMVDELLSKARGMGLTEEQHRFDTSWRIIFECCFQFEPANR